MKAFMAVRSTLAIAAVLMAGAAAWGQASASRPGMQPGFGEHRSPVERALGSQGKSGRWWNDPATVEKLKLTDVQRKSMDDVLQEHRERLVDLKGSLEKADIDLEPMMRDDQPNEAKILSQIDKVAQARAELEKANARFLLAIRAKLTPEQWKQLRALRGEGGQQHQGWQRDGHGMERRGQGGMMHGQCGMMHGDGGMMMNHHQQAPSGQSAPQGAVPQGAAPQDSGAPAPQQ
jgi:Spy/CpxP family protein refolding chaperone